MRRFTMCVTIIMCVALLLHSCSTLTYTTYYVSKEHKGWEQTVFDYSKLEGTYLTKAPWYSYTYNSKGYLLTTTFQPSIYSIYVGILGVPVIPQFTGGGRYKYIDIQTKSDEFKDGIACWSTKPKLLVSDNTYLFPVVMQWENDNTCFHRFERRLGKDETFTLIYGAFVDNGAVPPLEVTVEKQFRFIF